MVSEARVNDMAPDGDAGSDGPSGRLNEAVGERRLHLVALDGVIAAWEGSGTYGLACGLVSRAGGPPVLNVVSRGDRSRSVDVGCERVDGEWWYALAESGEPLVPVSEVDQVPGLLMRRVAGPAGSAAGSGVGR